MNTARLHARCLEEKNVDLGDHLPRRFRDLDLKGYDLIVNMSGSALPKTIGVPVENWNVDDPMGGSEDDFAQCAGDHRNACDAADSSRSLG